MDEFLTRVEHEEFARRMEDEHGRQNKRIELLEESTQKQNNLLSSIERLAVNMESMQKELTKQGKRLEVLENRDGEMWRKVVGCVATGIIGIVIGYIFTQIGF